jgi:hypothetical protein
LEADRGKLSRHLSTGCKFRTIVRNLIHVGSFAWRFADLFFYSLAESFSGKIRECSDGAATAPIYIAERPALN